LRPPASPWIIPHNTTDNNHTNFSIRTLGRVVNYCKSTRNASPGRNDKQ
jgi:hypothetical protein